MVNTFCKNENTCIERDSIRDVVLAIEIHLGSACRSTTLNEKELILTTLKALGNAGQWVDKEVVQNCYNEESNPAEVRIAALEAWRRAPCSFDRSGLLNTYVNPRFDSEIRIAAYLSLMACPTEELIENIKNKLNSESVNQVGTFVWTHLSNLQESASHEKQWIRELIGEEKLANKFNATALKFSRNLESSFYMEEIGFGSTMDSNIIFSSKSFLPRSGMLNLTLDLFGKSVNMFEIGGRFEGFEVFAEKFFGPEGYYPEETVAEILKSLRRGNSDHETTIEEMLDVITDEPEGSYYLRVLGNDVQYHHFRGIENFFEKKPKFDFLKIIADFAREGKTDYSKSYKFIDTEISYPTMTGLPLTLKLNSTATIGLRMDGQFSFESFRNINIDGHIYPSAAMEVDSTMLIDAHFTKSGVKVSTTARTSLFLDGHVKIEDGKLVDIKLSMPEDKIELINVKSGTVFFEDDRTTDTEFTSGDTEKCSGGAMMLGVELCTIMIAKPNYLQASIYLQKKDLHSGYIFKFSQAPNSVSLVIDTPNSEIDRKISFEVTRHDEDIKLDIQTPWKSLTATGSYVISHNGRKLDLIVSLDNTREFEVSLGHMASMTGSVTKYEPSVIIRTPSTIIMDLGGSLEFDSSSLKTKFDIQNRGAMPGSVQCKY